MKIAQIIEGKHEGISFSYNKGKLICFDREFDKQDIRLLVEIANLLELQGYPIKAPKETNKRVVDGLWGPREIEEKVYEEDNDD